jgi:hypothetical protein
MATLPISGQQVSTPNQVNPEAETTGASSSKPSAKQIGSVKQFFEKLKPFATQELLTAWQGKLEASHAGTLASMKDVYSSFAAEVLASLTRKGDKAQAVPLGKAAEDVSKDIEGLDSSIMEKWQKLHNSESPSDKSSTQGQAGNGKGGAVNSNAPNAAGGRDSMQAYQQAMSASGLSQSHMSQKMSAFAAALEKGDIGADTNAKGGEFKKMLIEARRGIKGSKDNFDNLLANDKGINFGMAEVAAASGTPSKRRPSSVDETPVEAPANPSAGNPGSADTPKPGTPESSTSGAQETPKPATPTNNTVAPNNSPEKPTQTPASDGIDTINNAGSDTMNSALSFNAV